MRNRPTGPVNETTTAAPAAATAPAPTTPPPEASGRGAGETGVAQHRARPGRRTAQERRDAVLALLAGKATVDQLARKLGVLPTTVEGWRTEAVGAVEEALRRGTSKTGRELELERENAVLRETVADSTMKLTLLQREMGIKPRPTRPARSWR
jgi:transposase-like protein